jgi:selenocysteine-specific elongation factor
MHIIGTAGHVDHGKSSLVRALTGTDPDRFAEEQRRGMTLDLGFAHLAFPDGVEAGIIDVPGHERFLHNMLAGAAGMEVVLLVVAANEGPKPQTLEHLAILAYLNARQTLIVLTKADTVDDAARAAVETRLRSALGTSFARDAAIYPVSTLTGDGLPELRTAIHAALIALPPRKPTAPAYLPIDRVFARVGHGTVVTGTLMQGRVAIGDTLTVSPPGRSVRVRSLQVFGTKRDEVEGGTRVAVNLPGIEIAEIARGAVLASPQLETAASFAVTFRPLASALDLLRRRTPVRAYIGSAEILGTLVFERAPTSAEPCNAQLHLRAPTIVIPNAPFVVRRVSPMNVLGGGIIAASIIAASDGADLGVDSQDERERDVILAAIAATGVKGATPAQIGAAANLGEARVSGALADLVADGRARLLAKPPGYVASALADDILARTIALLRARQREKPWLMGLTSLGLAQALAIAETGLIRILAPSVEAGALAYRSGYYATTDFRPQLSPPQRTFFERAFAAEPGAAPGPVSAEHLRATMRSSPVAELSAAFDTLVATGALSKVGDFIYDGAHLRAIRAQLEATIRQQGHITVAEFRTATGTSRKYAVPLLEFFDATGVTLRTGDLRVLRQAIRRP